MAANDAQLANYLIIWKTFEHIWTVDKDEYMSEYKLTNPSVATIDADIAG